MSDSQDDTTAMDDWLKSRCFSTEKDRWKKAAKVKQRSMSDWIRLTLNEAASKILKDK